MYYRKKMKAGALDDEKAKELEEVLAMRDLSIHTGGRKKIEIKTEIWPQLQVMLLKRKSPLSLRKAQSRLE